MARGITFSGCPNLVNVISQECLGWNFFKFCTNVHLDSNINDWILAVKGPCDLTSVPVLLNTVPQERLEGIFFQTCGRGRCKWPTTAPVTNLVPARDSVCGDHATVGYCVGGIAVGASPSVAWRGSALRWVTSSSIWEWTCFEIWRVFKWCINYRQ